MGAIELSQYLKEHRGTDEESLLQGTAVEVEIQKESDVRGVDDSSDMPRALATVEVRDRHGDIVRVDGMDLSNFEKNPVMLFHHGLTDFKMPVGKAENVQKTEVEVDGVMRKALAFTPNFDSDDFSQKVRAKYRDGSYEAFSIGFAPKSIEDVEPIVEEVEGEERVTGLDFKASELHEISPVGVGANPEALMLRAAEQTDGFSSEALKDYFEEQKMNTDENDGAESSEGPKSVHEMKSDLSDEIGQLQEEFQKELDNLSEQLQSCIRKLENTKELVQNELHRKDYEDQEPEEIEEIEISID